VANLLSDEQKRSVRFLKEFAQNSLQERYGVVGVTNDICLIYLIFRRAYTAGIVKIPVTRHCRHEVHSFVIKLPDTIR
jgi:hypothetical protein